jgi:hypothetical protein
MAKGGQRKLGSTRGRLRRTRTAKASRINRYAVKSRRAGEWGGWGRISVDGPGHYNPDRSEGPWGRATPSRSSSGAPPVRPSGTERNKAYHLESAKGAYKPCEAKGMPGAGSNRSDAREGTARHAGLEAVLGKTRRTEF